MQLDRQTLEQAQAQRLRRARRTAGTIGIIAFAVFVFSIAQMLWLQHHPQVRTHATTTDSLMQ
jgi:hypothetical protein